MQLPSLLPACMLLLLLPLLPPLYSFTVICIKRALHQRTIIDKYEWQPMYRVHRRATNVHAQDLGLPTTMIEPPPAKEGTGRQRIRTAKEFCDDSAHVRTSLDRRHTGQVCTALLHSLCLSLDSLYLSLYSLCLSLYSLCLSLYLIRAIECAAM